MIAEAQTKMEDEARKQQSLVSTNMDSLVVKMEQEHEKLSMLEDSREVSNTPPPRTHNAHSHHNTVRDGCLRGVHALRHGIQ